MPFQKQPLALDGVYELLPRRFDDNRGYFTETFNARDMEAAGLTSTWVQDNQSYSAAMHTLRGMHFQRSPHEQAKLVRVVRGRVLDVVVDIRPSSPTFCQWLSLELSAERLNQIYVPVGFAHGFLTLEPNCIVAYKVSNPYVAAAEAAIRWDDPQIGIIWPLQGSRPVLSDKDSIAPLISEADIGAL
jgi:dTDP-4-dehydrorhamnose 3,5-epimerase